MQKLLYFTQAIADETRFRVLSLLLDESLCVCELAEVLKLPQSTLSSQLQVIQRADLLESERRGKWMFYRVRGSQRALLKSLFKRFDATAAASTKLARDQKQAAKRVQCRDANCCPAKK